MDRNNKAVKQLAKDNGSLSARRAWIEMLATSAFVACAAVTLRKESVDRNADVVPVQHCREGRSPQGGRG